MAEKSTWVKQKNGEWYLQLGQIGCLSVGVRYAAAKNEQGVFVRGEPLGYEIYWLSPDYTYGEGLAIEHEKLFPLSAMGFEQAQEAAIVWAKVLLQEAIASID